MPKPQHIRLVLIRSAPNEWDCAGRLSGSADLPPAREAGERIGEIVAGLGDSALARVWCGPEESALVTARAVAGASGIKPRALAMLHEVGLGRWEGMSAADAESRYGSAFRQWREDPTAVVPPGGEPIPEAAERLASVAGETLSRCRVDGAAGVAIVVRPMAFGVLRCWLGGSGLSGLWSAAESEEWQEWFLVDRGSLRGGWLTPGGVRDAG